MNATHKVGRTLLEQRGDKFFTVTGKELSPKLYKGIKPLETIDRIVEKGPQYRDVQLKPEHLGLAFQALTRQIAQDPYGSIATLIDARTVRLSVAKPQREGGHSHYLIEFPEYVTWNCLVLEE